MVKSMESRFYVVYAEPCIEVKNGETMQMRHVPVSNRSHADVESAKKEYDELSTRIGKLLGLVQVGGLIGTSAWKQGSLA